MAPLVRYDRDEGVYTIILRDGAVARSVEMADAAAIVDVDDQDHVLSIEVLDPENAPFAALAEQFAFASAELAAIEEAVHANVPTVVTSTSASTEWLRVLTGADTLGIHGTPSSPGISAPPAREISLA